MILNFTEDKNKYKEEICSMCHKKLTDVAEEELVVKAQQEKRTEEDAQPEPSLRMSNSFISSIACLQQFAFNAIALIIDCAVLMQADFVRISIKRRNVELLYLDIQFSGLPLSNQ